MRRYAFCCHVPPLRFIVPVVAPYPNHKPSATLMAWVPESMLSTPPFWTTICEPAAIPTAALLKLSVPPLTLNWELLWSEMPPERFATPLPVMFIPDAAVWPKLNRLPEPTMLSVPPDTLRVEP